MMSNRHGDFCWYELMTTDMAAAAAFYGAVVGWTPHAVAAAPVPYTRFTAGGERVAGMMNLPEAARAAHIPPCWIGFVAVDDVDATAAQAAAAGGSIEQKPTDLAGVGRYALLRDPQGAVIVLFHGMGLAAMTKASALPGHTGWRELYTSDLEAGFAFYAALFGWTRSTAVDMGPMGTYQIFAQHGVDLGGMMRRPPAVPVSFWGYYFQVSALGDAIARLQAAGGAVLNGPNQVPGGRWVAQARDPQGAVFALVSVEA